ncbi:MAG: helix-turn-helix transcriptional regulator, partial [Actinomycetota bacterium]|nr:helix-turn-helix transcriptional regulator [Actinomycetota bacterium]
LRRQREERGLSLRRLGEITGVRHITINEIELGKSKTGPRLGTIKLIASKAGFDIHRIAHAAFDLDPPELLGELSGVLKRICEIVLSLTEQERELLLQKIEGWVEGIRDREGGGAKNETLDAQVGHG